MIDFPESDWTKSVKDYNKAQLVGTRLVVASESNKAKKLNTQLIKSFTGNDVISASHPYGRPFNFKSTSKHILAVNYPPIIEDDTHSMWRRIIEVPFLRKYSIDSAFEYTMKYGEKEATLAWAVEGARLYYANRSLGKIPDIVVATTDKLHNTIHSVRMFLEQRCVEEDGARVGAQELYDALTAWYNDRTAPPQIRLSSVAFAKKMAAEYSKYPKAKGHGRKEQNTSYYHGLRLAASPSSAGATD
jgi:P4 family phage/plasmid primase-like protien